MLSHCVHHSRSIDYFVGGIKVCLHEQYCPQFCHEIAAQHLLKHYSESLRPASKSNTPSKNVESLGCSRGQPHSNYLHTSFLGEEFSLQMRQFLMPLSLSPCTSFGLLLVKSSADGAKLNISHDGMLPIMQRIAEGGRS